MWNLFKVGLGISLSLAMAVNTMTVPQASANPERRAAVAAEADIPSEAITEALAYNRETDLYEFDQITAIEFGADAEDARAVAANIESLTPEQVADLNDLIGFDLEQYERFEAENRVIPAVLIPILAVVGTAAGTVIIESVTKWGLVAACGKLAGRYRAFDSYCRANGWQ